MEKNSEKFITIWEKSSSLQDVARLLKKDPRACSKLATSYRRRHGIPLKRFRRLSGVDSERLTELVHKIRGDKFK